MSKSEGNGKSQENKRKFKGQSKGTKGAQGSCKGKTKTGLSGLENLKSETSSKTQEPEQLRHVCTIDTSWIHDGSPDEWNDGWSSVGWHEGWKQTYDTSASSFSLGGLDAKSGPKRFEWVKMNLETGAAVNTFPLNFGPDGAGDERSYRTASGELIPGDGAWQFQGYDENGLLRSLNGRLPGVHKVLCSAAEIACNGRQDSYVGHDGGYMVPIHSKIGQGMRHHFGKWVSWYGKIELIPVYLENNIFNFYLNREVQSTETNNVHNAPQSGSECGRAVRS